MRMPSSRLTRRAVRKLSSSLIAMMSSAQKFLGTHASNVKKLVMKSSTAVYGASAQDPALFSEDMTARGPMTGFAKDSVEVEQYARDFTRRRPDVSATFLRFANFMGSGIETTLTRYFSLPLTPSPMEARSPSWWATAARCTSGRAARGSASSGCSPMGASRSPSRSRSRATPRGT